MIEVNNLSKSYGDKQIFENTDLIINENRIYGLLGRNGIGKSTLLKILSDQIINYGGRVTYNGKSIIENKDYKKDVILISDDLFSELLKIEKLSKILDLIKSLLASFDQSRFDELINLFNIDMKERYNKLSFGSQSMFRNIIGMASGAKFVYYDEPTNGLDEINRDLFYKKIMEYQELDETTIIIASHNVSDIERVISDVIILKDNKVLINESMEDLEAKSYTISLNPADLDLLANKNIINKNTLGNQLIVNVFDNFTANELAELDAKTRINRLNLRDLFISLNEEV